MHDELGHEPRARLRVLPSLAVRAAPGQQQCAGVGGVADELGTLRLNFVSTGIDSSRRDRPPRRGRTTVDRQRPWAPRAPTPGDRASASELARGCASRAPGRCCSASARVLAARRIGHGHPTHVYASRVRIARFPAVCLSTARPPAPPTRTRRAGPRCRRRRRDQRALLCHGTRRKVASHTSPASQETPRHPIGRGRSSCRRRWWPAGRPPRVRTAADRSRHRCWATTWTTTPAAACRAQATSRERTRGWGRCRTTGVRRRPGRCLRGARRSTPGEGSRPPPAVDQPRPQRQACDISAFEAAPPPPRPAARAHSPAGVGV